MLSFIFYSGKFEYRMVKEYSRPAADKYIRSEHLRTIDSLVNTALYLVNEFVKISFNIKLFIVKLKTLLPKESIDETTLVI